MFRVLDNIFNLKLLEYSLRQLSLRECSGSGESPLAIRTTPMYFTRKTHLVDDDIINQYLVTRMVTVSSLRLLPNVRPET